MMVDDRFTNEMPPGIAAAHVEAEVTPVAVGVAVDQVVTSSTIAATVETGQPAAAAAADDDAMPGGSVSAVDVVAKDERPVDESKESTDASASRNQCQSQLYDMDFICKISADFVYILNWSSFSSEFIVCYRIFFILLPTRSRP